MVQLLVAIVIALGAQPAPAPDGVPVVVRREWNRGHRIWGAASTPLK